jgi:GntR family transcriptional regulator
MAHSSLDLALERDSDVPLGTQLAWKLRAAIAGGSLAPGDRLPAVRELAALADVNVNTVRAVYARLSKAGVIDSEHGRGTFVAAAPAAPAGLGGLVERAAAEARSRGVDPRELAALLYARFDAAAAGSPGASPGTAAGSRAASPGTPAASPPLGPDPLPSLADVEARRALRLEIEALEHELAALEPQFGTPEGEPEQTARAGAGARLMDAGALEATRDELAERLSARRREARAARVKARYKDTPRPAATTSSAGPWPELRASGLRLLPGA